MPYTAVRVLQNDLTTGNGVELNPVDLQNARDITLYVTFGPGTSAGGVTFEEAASSGYAGAWSIIGAAVAWSAASKTHVIRATGVGLFARARISTNIVGGTVKVIAVLGGN